MRMVHLIYSVYYVHVRTSVCTFMCVLVPCLCRYVLKISKIRLAMFQPFLRELNQSISLRHIRYSMYQYVICNVYYTCTVLQICMCMYMRISENHNSLGCEQPSRPRC